MTTPTYELKPDNSAGKTVRSGLVYLDRLADGRLEHRCLRDGCTFRRLYGTLQGAMHGVSQHLRQEHHVRAVWA